MIHDFARQITLEWKGWLTGTAPMVTLMVLGLVNPEWIHFPLWAWAEMVFGVGFFFAMFRVYRELRTRRDALQEQLSSPKTLRTFIRVPMPGQKNVSHGNFNKQMEALYDL